jgi:hypothetical protein
VKTDNPSIIGFGVSSDEKNSSMNIALNSIKQV